MQHIPEDPLYVMPIGAINNITNAVLLKPEITKNIVVIWLGCHAHDWLDTKGFNMFQDKAAAEWIGKTH
jgi:inosine-uridine nucleoside N-ribohydrolase